MNCCEMRRNLEFNGFGCLEWEGTFKVAHSSSELAVAAVLSLPLWEAYQLR